MTIAPVTETIYDVPTQIVTITRRINGEEGFAAIGKAEANQIFKILERFVGGMYHFVDLPAERDLDGRGCRYTRQWEASYRTVAAFRAVFGDKYKENLCKKMIQKVLIAEVPEVPNKDRYHVSKGDVALVRAFFVAWQTELQRTRAW